MPRTERVRCKVCGRWIVDVERRDNGLAWPVGHRVAGSRWLVDGPQATVAERAATRRTIAAMHAAAWGAEPEDADFWLPLFDNHDVTEVLGGMVTRFECAKCGHWTVVSRAM